ncbi:ribonucleoprotein A, chloroplastic [Cinnamomum micranthum f. kanehirae]|uniref:Ribonucleoprotein A, chloroplastic n=1 Tax=Cinnamomum micranthum f. kanehirae TaxID=337451 RepID=A0A443P7Q8_9MAGN|nr:ribonucleoprotein A, chloroplastic [Cinnamomum micranthum f. kanehirae]
MAALAASSLFSGSPKFLFFSHRPLQSPSLKLQIPLLQSPFSPKLHLSTKIHPFQLFSAVSVQENPLESNQQETPDEKTGRIYVVNLPWDFTATDIKNLFSQCGTVKDTEVMKQKNGKSRGFAFVTMETWEEARAAINRFNSFELQGRTIRVEFARSMKKPPPPPPESATVEETQHKLYVSNLAWKVRSSHLREFFAAYYNPVSTRVVFDGPSGRSAGYGFVSLSTKEEVDAAISTLDGKIDSQTRKKERTE